MMENFKYIVYGIFDTETGYLKKVGRFPSTTQLKSQTRIEKSLKSGFLFRIMGEFDRYDDCVKLVIHLRRNIIKLGDGEVMISHKKEGRITKRKGENGEVIRQTKPIFVNKHQPGDVNGDLMYIKDWTGQHQIVKV